MGAYTVKIPDDLELAYLAKLGYFFNPDDPKTIPDDVPGTIQGMLQQPIDEVLKQAAKEYPEVKQAEADLKTAQSAYDLAVEQKINEIKPK